MPNREVSLLDLVDITGGGTPSRAEPRFWGGDIPWATVKDLSDTSIWDTSEHITTEGLENSATNVVPHGTVVLATRIVPGKAALARVDLAINQDLKGLLAKDGVDPVYLLHFMNSVAPRLGRMATGSTVRGVTLETLGRIRIALPPLARQQRIAGILSTAESIRRRRLESLRLVDELLNSVYARVVGRENPHYTQWPELSIADLAEHRDDAMRTGPFGSALRHAEFTSQGDVAVIGIDNVVENRFRWAAPRFITRERYERQFKRYTVRAGDVLVTIMGTTGKSAVVPDDVRLAISTKHLATISLDRERACPEYVSHAIHMDPLVLAQIRGANRGAIMSGLNLGVIRHLKVRLPPMPEQLAFVRVVKQTRSLTTRFADYLQMQERLFRSLLQRAFSGDAL